MNNIIPLNRAWLWILLSTLMISGSALMGFLYYLHVNEMRINDSRNRIIALIQQCDQKESSLKTAFLAQLLDLSTDKPTNLYQYNIAQNEKKLIKCPLIKTAAIRKVPPNSLYVQYQSRVPIAYLGDYTNTAMDGEGYLFPLRPFFIPKRLPLIYFGIERCWGQTIANDDRFILAMEILKQLEAMTSESLYVNKIDVSDAFSESDGNRQIVVALSSNQGKIYLLRLNSTRYREGLHNFRLMIGRLQQSAVVDLRISKLAFVIICNDCS